MEKFNFGRGFRFFCLLKSWFPALILGIFILSTPISGKINGYLSCDYARGQEQSIFSTAAFQNPRFGLFVSGVFSEKLSFLSEISLRNEAEVEIEQAFLAWNASKSFSVKMGLYRVPFGDYNLYDRAHQTLLIYPPLNIAGLYPERWRDIGVIVEGSFAGLSLVGYIGNGLVEAQDFNHGQQFKDNNSDKGKGGKIGFSLGEGLEMAYSIYNCKVDVNNERSVMFHGISVQWLPGEIQVHSEWTRARIQNPDPFDEGKLDGYFISASFKVGDFQPLACYQKISYDDPFHGVGFIGPGVAGNGILEDKTRWALGIVLSLAENAFLKFEYDINKEKDSERKDNTLTFQVALGF